MKMFIFITKNEKIKILKNEMESTGIDFVAVVFEVATKGMWCFLPTFQMN